MGRFQFPQALVPGQPSPSRRWHPCCRRCLLKGCERWFLPRQPQTRYCSPACQDAARRWRCWMARQRYRATPNGQQHRRDQARRYRAAASDRLAPTRTTPPPTANRHPRPSKPSHRFPPSHPQTSPPPPWVSARPKSPKKSPVGLATDPAVMSCSSPHHAPPIRSSVRPRVARLCDASDSAKPDSGSGADGVDDRTAAPIVVRPRPDSLMSSRIEDAGHQL